MSANLPAEFQKYAGHKRYLKKLLRETRCTVEEILKSKYFNSLQLTETLLSLPEEDLIHQVIDHPTGIIVLGERTSAKAIVVNELLGYPLLPVINDSNQPLARAPTACKQAKPSSKSTRREKPEDEDEVDADIAKVAPNGHGEAINGCIHQGNKHASNGHPFQADNGDITTWRTCKFMYGHQPSVTLAVQNTYELVEHLAANDNHHRSSSIWQQIPASDLELKPQPSTAVAVATSSIGHGDNSSSSATTGSCCSGGPHHPTHPHTHHHDNPQDIYFPHDFINQENAHEKLNGALNGHHENAHINGRGLSLAKEETIDPGYFQATLECKLPHDLLAHDVQLIIAPSLDDFNEIYNLCFDSVNPIVIYAISSDAHQLSQREMEHLRHLRKLSPKLPIFFVRTPSATLFQPSMDEDEFEDEIEHPLDAAADLHRYKDRSDLRTQASNPRHIPGASHIDGLASPASSLQEITELTESQQHSMLNGNHAHLNDPMTHLHIPQSQTLIASRSATAAVPGTPHSYNAQMMADAAEKLNTINKSLHDNLSPTNNQVVNSNGNRPPSPELKAAKLAPPPATGTHQKNGYHQPLAAQHHQVDQYQHYHRQRQRRQHAYMEAVECHNKMTIRPRRTMSCSSTTSSKINHDRAASSLIIYQQLTTLGFLNLDFSLRNIRHTLASYTSGGSSSTKTSPSSTSTTPTTSPTATNGQHENESEQLSEALLNHKMQVEMFTEVNSEFVDNFDNFASILLHVRHVLQASLVQVANVLNNLHTRCLRLFICSAFDMTWDLMITPRRIDYAKQREAELFESLMSIANRKQEEIRDMIIDTISVMREGIVEQAAIYDFKTPIADHRNLSSREVQLCIGEIQEMVLSLLNAAIAGKLIGSVDYLRDSYVGTLERCLTSLERSCQEAGESLMASHSLKQILNAAYQVEVNIKTSSSFMRVLWEKMKQVLESLTWRHSPVSVNDVEWKKKVALDVLRSLSESRLARSVCYQLKERLRISHDHFAQSMRQLEQLHNGRLERTEEQRIKVRKLHAPRVAKLSLEATSLVDLIMFGMPQLGREIGRGQYGVVYSCDSWGSFSPCAIKSVVPPDEKHWNDLAMEFYYTRSLPEHERIVQIRGSVIDHSYGGGSSPAVLLIMERLSRDLYAAIKAGLDWLSRLQVALDVVQGIRFLHSQGLVHRDIKLKNVLLDKRNRAKITDLGFCKPEAMMSGSIVGTPIHMAPELFSGKYDGSVDVYAFGILFWYICAGHVRLPYIFEQCQSKDQLWNCVRRGARPERLPQFDDESWALMEESWAGDPAKRPLLGEVEPRLRAILDKYKNQEPPNGYKKNYMRYRPQLQSRGSRSASGTTHHHHQHHPSQHGQANPPTATGHHHAHGHPHHHKAPSHPAPHQHIHQNPPAQSPTPVTSHH